MSNLQLDWTAEEILADDRVDDPLVVRDVVCHGGYVHGAYVSPRSRFRRDAIDAWQQHHRETFGVDVREAPLDVFPGHYPSLEQAQFLLDHDVREPIVGILTRVGTVEGYGGAIRELTPRGDVQRFFVEDVRGTATAHLAAGLLEAHARDESGWDTQAGHDRMWYAVRDIAFENPLDRETEADLRAVIDRAALSVPTAMGMPERRFDKLDPNFDALVTFMTRVLFIEVRAFHAFAWAEALLADADRVAGDGEAARLVSYIRQDESPHVGYLRTALSEMRERTFIGDGGVRYAGSDVIDSIWDSCLAESLGMGDRRNRAIAEALLDHALADRPDGREVREEFDRIGNNA
ncbi:MAG: hypothetical protein JO222_12210 [Frankiales bacterium]|nr:hypothetical protein [Frankiales bacterium]